MAAAQSFNEAVSAVVRDHFRQQKHQHGWTQQSFGRQIGLTQSMVSSIFSGRRGRRLTLDTWMTVARAFDLTLSTLIAQAEARVAATRTPHAVPRRQQRA